MDVTKWPKPSISVSRIGDSASVQAATRVNAEQAVYGLLKSSIYFTPLSTPPLQFLCSTWNPVSSLRPTHVLRPTRTGPVQVGRGSALAARSVVSRPRLDRPAHVGDAGCSRDDDQRGALPSGADHRATTLYSVGP